MKSFESIARSAYDEFQRALQHSPTETPEWVALSPQTQEAWIASARKVAEEINQVH